MPIDTDLEFYNLFFNRLLTKGELQNALLNVLKIDPTQIEVATPQEWSNPETWEVDRQVFCLMNEFQGDFPSSLCIIFSPEIIQQLNFYDFCHQINKQLKTDCLIDNPEDKILSHYLLSRQEKLYEVRLNTEYLNLERPIFILEEIIKEYSPSSFS